MRLVVVLMLGALGAAAQEAPKATVHAKPRPRAAGAVDSDWPTLLGPRVDGVSPETHLLEKWGAGPKLLWSIPKGEGYASPVVVGDRVVLFHRVGDFEEALCLDRTTGAFRWRFRQPTTYRDRFGFGVGPRATPVVDGERVYVFGAQRKLACLELATGKRVWARDFKRELRLPTEYFGNASTPLVLGKHLIVNVGAPKANVVALDKTTGKRVWAADDRWGASYASPVAATIRGKSRVLVFAGGESDPPHGGLLCLDPATGAIDFRFPWRSKSVTSVNAACPVVVGDRVFVSASYETGGALVEVTPAMGHKVLWTAKRFGTHWTTAIHRAGHLYGFDGRHMKGSELVCYSLAGKEVWRKKLRWKETVGSGSGAREVSVGVYRAILLHADGRFLCLGELGHLAWLKLTPEGCTVLAKCRLFDARETWAPPALSRGLLYVTQNERDRTSGAPASLRCYDLRK